MNPLMILGIVGGVIVLVMAKNAGINPEETQVGVTAPHMDGEQAYWNNILNNLDPLAISNWLGGSGGNGGTGNSTINPDRFFSVDPGDWTIRGSGDLPLTETIQIGEGAASGGRFFT